MQLNTEKFSEAMVQAMTSGTAVAILQDGGAPTQVGTYNEILSNSLGAFIDNAIEQLLEVEDKEIEEKAFFLIEKLAVGEALYEVALHIESKEVQPAIRELRDALRAIRLRLSDLGTDDWNREGLIELMRLAVRIGRELFNTDQGMAGTQSVYDLLREVGTHADSFTSYQKTIEEIFGKTTPTEVKGFLPIGRDFQEIQRRRVRWGNPLFTP